MARRGEGGFKRDGCNDLAGKSQGQEKWREVVEKILAKLLQGL